VKAATGSRESSSDDEETVAEATTSSLVGTEAMATRSLRWARRRPGCFGSPERSVLVERQDGMGRGDAVRLPGEGKALKGGNPIGACGMKQGHEVLRGVNRRGSEKDRGRNVAGQAKPRVSGLAALAQKGPETLGEEFGRRRTERPSPVVL